MKNVYILWNRLKTHFEEHFLLVLLFLLGIFSSTLFYIYYYGDYVKPSSFITGLESVISQYKIVLSEPISASDDRIASLEEKGSVTVYSTELLSADNTDVILKSESEYEVQAKKGNDFGYTAIYGSVDLNQNVSSIIFSYSDIMMSNISLENLQAVESVEVSYGGVSLTVIGVHSMGLSGCVPYELFENGALSVDSLQVELPGHLSQNESADFVISLQNMFPESEVIDPYVYYGNYLKAEDEQKPMVLIKAMGLMLLAVFTFMFLAKYLFDMSLRENVVYRLVGAERADIVLLALGEILILAATSVLSAVFVHIFFYDSFFEKIRISSNQPYIASDYLIIASSSLLVCVIACIPFLISFWRKTVIQLKNDVE